MAKTKTLYKLYMKLLLGEWLFCGLNVVKSIFGSFFQQVTIRDLIGQIYGECRVHCLLPSFLLKFAFWINKRTHTS